MTGATGPLIERGMNEYGCPHRVSLIGQRPVEAQESKDWVGAGRLLLFGTSQLFTLIKDYEI